MLFNQRRRRQDHMRTPNFAVLVALLLVILLVGVDIAASQQQELDVCGQTLSEEPNATDPQWSVPFAINISNVDIPNVLPPNTRVILTITGTRANGNTVPTQRLEVEADDLTSRRVQTLMARLPSGRANMTATASISGLPNPVFSCEFRGSVADIHRPVITCPATVNTSLVLPSSLSSDDIPSVGTNVTFSIPSAQDAVDGVIPANQVSSSREPGSLFPLGRTSVRLTVGDAAGNIATCTFLVIVTAKPKFTLLSPQRLASAEGSAYELTCQAAGYPVDLHWYHNGVLLDSQARQQRQLSLQKSQNGLVKLVFSSLVFSDRGQYACVAEQNGERTFSRPSNLFVRPYVDSCSQLPAAGNFASAAADLFGRTWSPLVLTRIPFLHSDQSQSISAREVVYPPVYVDQISSFVRVYVDGVEARKTPVANLNSNVSPETELQWTAPESIGEIVAADRIGSASNSTDPSHLVVASASGCLFEIAVENGAVTRTGCNASLLNDVIAVRYAGDDRFLVHTNGSLASVAFAATSTSVNLTVHWHVSIANDLTLFLLEQVLAPGAPASYLKGFAALVDRNRFALVAVSTGQLLWDVVAPALTDPIRVLATLDEEMLVLCYQDRLAGYNVTSGDRLWVRDEVVATITDVDYFFCARCNSNGALLYTMSDGSLVVRDMSDANQVLRETEEFLTAGHTRAKVFNFGPEMMILADDFGGVTVVERLGLVFRKLWTAAGGTGGQSIAVPGSLRAVDGVIEMDLVLNLDAEPTTHGSHSHVVDAVRIITTCGQFDAPRISVSGKTKATVAWDEPDLGSIARSAGTAASGVSSYALYINGVSTFSTGSGIKSLSVPFRDPGTSFDVKVLAQLAGGPAGIFSLAVSFDMPSLPQEPEIDEAIVSMKVQLIGIGTLTLSETQRRDLSVHVCLNSGFTSSECAIVVVQAKVDVVPPATTIELIIFSSASQAKTLGTNIVTAVENGQVLNDLKASPVADWSNLIDVVLLSEPTYNINEGEPEKGNVDNTWVIIVAVIGGIVALLLIATTIAIIVRRRRESQEDDDPFNHDPFAQKDSIGMFENKAFDPMATGTSTMSRHLHEESKTDSLPAPRLRPKLEPPPAGASGSRSPRLRSAAPPAGAAAMHAPAYAGADSPGQSLTMKSMASTHFNAAAMSPASTLVRQGGGRPAAAWPDPSAGSHHYADALTAPAPGSQSSSFSYSGAYVEAASVPSPAATTVRKGDSLVYVPAAAVNLQDIRSFATVDPSTVHFGTRLGAGRFGDIFMAMIDSRNAGAAPLRCVAYVSKQRMTQDELVERLVDKHEEVTSLIRLDHPNLLLYRGVMLRNGCPVLLADDSDGGSLPAYFDLDSSETISVSTMLEFACQVAAGMAHLDANRLVHGALRAGCCFVVSQGPLIRVGDFGFERIISKDDIVTDDRRVRTDVARWCAPEVALGRVSSAADVWSFASLLWEIFHRCQFVPYHDRSDEEVAANVGSNTGLDRPFSCPPLIFNVMLQCWSKSRTERPKIHKVLSQLRKLKTNESVVNFVPRSYVNLEQMGPQSHATA